MTETSGRYDRHNLMLNIAEGGSYVAGASLISAVTVIPALINRLGGGNVTIGALSVIVWAGLFLPQVFASRYGETLPWKKPWVITSGLVQRLVILGIGGIILFLGSSHNELTLTLFLIFFAVNHLLMGVATPVWFDLYAKLTPISKRGRLTGMRNSVSGGLSFIGGLFLTWLLATFLFPFNYALVFFTAFVLQLISLILQTRLVEEYPSGVLPRQSLVDYVAELSKMLRANPNFRAFLIASVFLILAAMPVSFFTVYALHNFRATGSDIGTFTIMMVTGQMIGGLLNGYIADRYGNKLALVSSCAGALIACIGASLAPSLLFFHAVFFFAGMNLGSELLTRYNLAIEYGPVVQRSTYLGLMNTALAPVYFAGLLGGWIVDHFGYSVIFILGAICSTTGILLLLFHVNDPRFLPARSSEGHVSDGRVIPSEGFISS